MKAGNREQETGDGRACDGRPAVASACAVVAACEGLHVPFPVPRGRTAP
jgi:hypothetical protein